MPLDKEKMTKNSLLQPIGSFNLECTSAEEAYVQTIERLCALYCILQPEKTVSDFHEFILKPIAESIDNNSLNVQIQTYADHSKYTYRPFITWIITSCMHTVKAHVADEAGLKSKAWSHTINARYYLGLIEGTIILEPALEHIISARSTSGARKRDEKFGPLRELARELAAKKYYPSKRQAALDIKNAILAEAKIFQITLSEMQAERTITGWLEGMSFGGKRQP